MQNWKTVVTLYLIALLAAPAVWADEYAQARQQLMEEIGESVRDTSLCGLCQAFDQIILQGRHVPSSIKLQDQSS